MVTLTRTSVERTTSLFWDERKTRMLEKSLWTSSVPSSKSNQEKNAPFMHGSHSPFDQPSHQLVPSTHKDHTQRPHLPTVKFVYES